MGSAMESYLNKVKANVKPPKANPGAKFTVEGNIRRGAQINPLVSNSQVSKSTGTGPTNASISSNVPPTVERQDDVEGESKEEEAAEENPRVVNSSKEEVPTKVSSVGKGHGSKQDRKKGKPSHGEKANPKALMGQQRVTPNGVVFDPITHIQVGAQPRPFQAIRGEGQLTGQLDITWGVISPEAFRAQIAEFNLTAVREHQLDANGIIRNPVAARGQLQIARQTFVQTGLAEQLIRAPVVAAVVDDEM